MTTTVASAQVQLTPAVTGFAQRLRSELRSVESRIGDLSVKVVPKIDQSAYRTVTRQLDRLTRERTVRFRADADTRVAADELAVLARDRRTTVRADADTRVAADELALLTRDRTVRVTARVSGTSAAASAAGGAAASGIVSTLVSLAPALVPVAAYLGSIAVQGGAAAIAIGAVGLAAAPQIAQFKALSDAETKASQSVSKYGATSKQAVAAQQAVADTLNGMPAATQTAAGAFLVLKKDFTGWSNSLAEFTMVPVTQGLGIVDAILPKLSPMVKDTSTQFSRLTTLLAGGVNSGAFDGIINRFTAFTNGVLTKGVDEVVHFSRVLSEGSADGPVSKFMEYARQEGPAVRETLTNIVSAVSKVIEGSAQAGPGILSIVNAVAKLVASLPPSFIGHAMQAYTAFKLISLARSGIIGTAGAVSSLTTRVTAMRASSVAAGGGLTGLRAAFMGLSTAAKASVVVGAIAALVVGFAALSKVGQKAPPDLDKMSTAIGNLGLKGKATGELTKTFGADLDGLGYAVNRVAGKSSGMDKFNDVMNTTLTLGFGQSNSLKKAKQDIDSVDKSLASLVQSGHADLAAAALKDLDTAYVKQGGKPGTLAKEMDNYNSALADAAFQQKLVAQSQGLFGNQAQAVSKQLDSQKASADGLRQSLQALNDVNRSALDDEIGLQSAMDAATQAAKDNGKALSMRNGQLQLGSEKARNEASALSDLAAKTDSAAASARDNGASWSKVNSIYDQGRAKLIASAQAMGLTKQQAQQLAAQILRTPNKTASLKGDISDLQTKLKTAQTALKTAPASKTTAIKGDIAQLQAQIRSAQRQLESLHDKTVAINIVTTNSTSGTVAHEGGNYATGGILPGYTPGRDVHHFYSPSAGSLNLSGGESIMRPEWTRAVGPAVVHAWNRLSRSRGVAGVRQAMGFKDGGILGGSYASGGITGTKTQNVVIVAGKKINEGSIASAIGNAFVASLKGTTSQIQSAVSNVVSSIKTAFKGAKTTVDDNLINALNKQSTQLQNLAKKRDSIKATITAANTYATNASDSAKSFANMTSLPSAGGSFDAKGILSGLNVRLGQIKKFSSNLALLAKRGLSKTLLNQLVQAGPEAGSAYAQALADASLSTLKSINSTQSAIDKASTAYGRNVADTMYDSGSQAGKGFLTGLQAQESAIEKEMSTLANKIQAAIKKALKINSPSKVTEELGEFTGQGFLVGMDNVHPDIEASARHMANLVASAHPGSASIEREQEGAGQAQTNNYFDLQTTDLPTEEGILLALRKHAVLRRPALLPGG